MQSREWREIALKVGVLLLIGVLISVAGYGYSRSRFREHAVESAEKAAGGFVKTTSWTKVEAEPELVDQWEQACPSVQTAPAEETADARGHLEKVRISSTELTETGATVELTPDGGRSVFTLVVKRSGEGKDEEWHVTEVSCATP
ncbi:hypothetical protein J2S40_002429 [Nocardioides luteus]|uniref:Uncharacterized protein n=1 Tax=Nocardioides luteus TaxID=1844 RepID=A0ABQ5SSV3_9ACTN|nr:hypothetical protein [Nocardioides luteus]MDR7311371.1 hypothetical protein [Nocardioides luteus]GGR65455.1 hypothetical protein GCM10010197_36250 [Nocardioides luteus]GLJ66876.1 hypothetical protein GCM10017579_09120 [Nocardioides luteus]